MDRLTKQQKIKIKEILLLRKEQKDNLWRLTLPIEDNIKIGKEVLEGKQSIENFIKHTEIVQSYIKKLSETIKEEKCHSKMK